MTPTRLCRMAAKRIDERKFKTTYGALMYPYSKKRRWIGSMSPWDAWEKVARLLCELMPEIDEDNPHGRNVRVIRNARILALLLLGEILKGET